MPYKRCDLAGAHVMAEVIEGGAGLAVRLETDAPAFWVARMMEDEGD